MLFSWTLYHIKERRVNPDSTVQNLRVRVYYASSDYLNTALLWSTIQNHTTQTETGESYSRSQSDHKGSGCSYHTLPRWSDVVSLVSGSACAADVSSVIA